MRLFCCKYQNHFRSKTLSYVAKFPLANRASNSSFQLKGVQYKVILFAQNRISKSSTLKKFLEMILRKNGAKWVQYSALCFTKCNFGLTKGLGGLYCFGCYQCHSFLSLLLCSMTVNSKNAIFNDMSYVIYPHQLNGFLSQFDSKFKNLSLKQYY